MPSAKYTIFMLLTARPEWLRLTRDERSRIAGEALETAMAGLNVNHRHFDAEAFSAFCSDVAVFETGSLGDYYFTIERLRDTPFFAVPYFDVVAIIPAIEDGFAQFEKSEAAHAV
ncbi:darcynin family protein [Rhizobium sp. L1K21]|uniref:darcynin family protein n=1 Tax=Rhizobium sp. L1K21 TaxID=2954933 RepID=UPI002092F859|nr:darcynin family protein [Rhizobium sp. L1K21]MCO6186249.1 hypothetical protein [Rhizobium sp. L1K21]